MDVHSQSDKRAYGCLFVTTGREREYAERLQRDVPGVCAFAACREKHHTVKGVRNKVIEVMMPGYVFFQADAEIVPWQSFPREHLIRVLTIEKDVWQLVGEDERFVKWLMTYDGLLGFSKAYREGTKVRIASGPLKDLEGRIVKVDNRGRSGKVSLEFNGRQMVVWLGFDLIDPLVDAMAEMGD